MRSTVRIKRQRAASGYWETCAGLYEAQQSRKERIGLYVAAPGCTGTMWGCRCSLIAPIHPPSAVPPSAPCFPPHSAPVYHPYPPQPHTTHTVPFSKWIGDMMGVDWGYDEGR